MSRRRCNSYSRLWLLCKIALFTLIICLIPKMALGKNPYRRDFFKAYPTAKDSTLDDVNSHGGHCGVCHYDFGGSGPKNPYGLAVRSADWILCRKKVWTFGENWVA